ncbi:MAG TPA: protoporphyrinogen oxidase [Chloroflexota bacterium]
MGSGIDTRPPGSAFRVAVIGGGIAGLSAAFHLQEGARSAGIPLDCTLIEADGRLGGKIITRKERGFAVEGGPDSFLTQKPWGIELCKRLGIFDRLVGTNEASRRVWILWNGKLHKLPDGVLLVVPTRLQPFVFSTLISPLGKLRMGMDLIIPARRDASDESVGDFIRRRLGEEALEKIAEPLMGGIHVSDPDRQSLLASFPRFADIERKHGSLVRGMLAGSRAHHPGNGKALPPFMTLRGGLADLTGTLVERLDGVRLITGRKVEAMSLDGGYRLALDDGARLDFDAVVLANPAKDAAALVSSIDPALAGKLSSIRYVSTATISFGYRRDEIHHSLKGFGFVIPRKEHRLITGCTWSSTKFDDRAPAGHVLLRCFLGGATDERPALASEDEMIGYARQEMRSLMGITAEPVLTEVFRWKDGHAQYDVGHLDLVAEIEALAAGHPGLRLAGSSYRGVGLPDCIRSGAQAADAILKLASSSPEPVHGAGGTRG